MSKQTQKKTDSDIKALIVGWGLWKNSTAGSACLHPNILKSPEHSQYLCNRLEIAWQDGFDEGLAQGLKSSGGISE